MTISILKNAVPLLKKSIEFNSSRTPGYRMTNTKYYTKSPLMPKIESHKFSTRDGIKCEFSTKSFQDGSKLDVFRLPDEIIKVVKNRFGEIKAFKSSIEQHNSNPEKTYEKAKEVISAKTRNFLA
ncbi:hypothetical protein KID03_09460 [bacterium]|jgi:hypothetical protein|uniref:Uncharacterized protein n=1 Tax=Candidatus Scatenecus faecavium TaxID=2840915 RepID=A0A9D1FW79_9BACT|nr:hypothetical protein [bacterium]HIS83234.1 hypothetical protein [Candidatus Scatenecus faecavium]